MSRSLNISSGMTLKTKQIFHTKKKRKRNNVTWQNILPFLMRHRKDKVRVIETQFLDSYPPAPPRTRPFQNDFVNEQTLLMSNNDPESFHCAIGSILVLAQLFGILPVSGICSPSPLQLKFVKFSFRTIYTIFISVLVLIMAILSVVHMIKTLNSVTFEVKGGVGAATAGAMFYSNCLISTLIFFRLSPRWTTLQRDWRSMEQFID
ncbi:gustatory receptor for sugar taste 64b-like, partial [Monomorium pharaonis]